MLAGGREIRYRIPAILEEHFDDFVASSKQWIRPVVFETVRKIIACRTPALGCHLYQCPACGRYEVVPHSCKSRFCPTCGKLATDRWADGVLNDLLDVPYHHLVLSAPWQLRILVALNRWVGLSIYARAAVACFNQWARECKGMRMGIVSVLHTFGSDMKWHPHVHLLVTEGGLSLDGKRWINPYDRGFLIHHASLKRMWRYHVISAFRRAHRQGELTIPDEAPFLRQYPKFSAFLSKLYKLTWYAHIGACLLDAGPSLRYIGRYTKRAVLAEYRITHCDGRTVRFAYRDYATGGKTAYKTLSVNTFIGRLLRHVPDKHFKMVRHAGLFAPRWKKHYLAQARQALGPDRTAKQAVPTKTTPTSLATWRERNQAQGNDPLWCTDCGQEMILVGTVFGAHSVIEQWFQWAGRPTKHFHPAWAKPG